MPGGGLNGSLMSIGPALYDRLYRLYLGEPHPRPWLFAALLLGSLPYLQALIATLLGPFTIDDDARQLVFWMVRWRDPELFQNDLIADYFASVSPPGFRAAYWLPAQLGLDPVLASKFYPLALNLVMTFYAFRLAWQLTGGRLPAAFLCALGCAFLVAWSHIIISGTPRAFGVPLLMPFLYYTTRKSTAGVAIMTLLIAITYPPAAALALGSLGLTLIRWRGGPRFDFSAATLLPLVIAGLLGVSVLLIAAFDRPYGPIATLADIRTLPMFSDGGRMPLLNERAAFNDFGCGQLVGVVPIEWCQLVNRRPVAPILLGILLAVLVWAAREASAGRSKAERPVEWAPIVRFFVAGAILYGVAFILMLKLHVPSRYAVTPLRVTGLFAVTMLGVLLAERTLRAAGPRITQSLASRQWLQVALAVFTIAAFAALYPLDVSRRNVRPNYPAILSYLSNQPKTILVAGMGSVVSNIPAFARRSVLAASEYAIPVDLGYIRRYRARVNALIDAQYAIDPAPLAKFLRQYKVTHLIIDPAHLRPEGLRRVWWRREHATAHMRATMSLAGGAPALYRFLERCTVFRERTQLVISAACLIKLAAPKSR